MFTNNAFSVTLKAPDKNVDATALIKIKNLPDMTFYGEAKSCTFKVKSIENQASARAWFFSKNNYHTRNSIYNLSDVEHPLLDVETAVYAGNVLRLILGVSYPKFFVCEIANYEQLINKAVNKALLESHPYARISEEIDDFYLDGLKVYEDSISIFDKNYLFTEIQNSGINGLTAMLVAGYFIYEQDWNNGNYGFIKNTLQAVRIDPATTFGDPFFSETKNEIYIHLQHLLKNYIYQTLKEENYFAEFKIDLDDPFNNELIDENLNDLFNSKEELFKTLSRIISLPFEMYELQAEQDFSNKHQLWVKKFILTVQHRISEFKKAALQLEGFKDYYDKYIKKYAGSQKEELDKLRKETAAIKNALQSKSSTESKDISLLDLEIISNSEKYDYPLTQTIYNPYYFENYHNNFRSIQNYLAKLEDLKQQEDDVAIYTLAVKLEAGIAYWISPDYKKDERYVKRKYYSDIVKAHQNWSLLLERGYDVGEEIHRLESNMTPLEIQRVKDQSYKPMKDRQFCSSWK